MGSAGVGAMASLHERLENRLLVALASTPQRAASTEADFASLLGDGQKVLSPTWK